MGTLLEIATIIWPSVCKLICMTGASCDWGVDLAEELDTGFGHSFKHFVFFLQFHSQFS